MHLKDLVLVVPDSGTCIHDDSDCIDRNGNAFSVAGPRIFMSGQVAFSVTFSYSARVL